MLWFPILGMERFTLFCHLGTLLNGIGGVIATAAPLLISAAWFPPSERTRQTCKQCLIDEAFTFALYNLEN